MYNSSEASGIYDEQCDCRSGEQKAYKTLSDLQNAIKVRKQRFNESKFAVESRIKMQADRAVNFAQSKAREILGDGRRRADEAEDDWERKNG